MKVTPERQLRFALSVVSGSMDPDNVLETQELLGMTVGRFYCRHDYLERAEEIVFEWLTGKVKTELPTEAS